MASQEPNAAIESYHLSLKTKLFNELYANHWPRVDWLIHILTTEIHSFYWLEQYIIETGYFENLRDVSLTTNSWYRALHIPDADVLLDEQNLQLAKVISQTDRTLAYTIWNPGSEFCICDCPWSRLGNLCKHAIKVAILCKSRQVARPLLSAQVYRQALLTLLQNPPDDPLVLDHAILHVTRLQQDIKGLEELSNSGLLQPLPPETNSQMVDNIPIFPRLHWFHHWRGHRYFIWNLLFHPSSARVRNFRLHCLTNLSFASMKPKIFACQGIFLSLSCVEFHLLLHHLHSWEKKVNRLPPLQWTWKTGSTSWAAILDDRQALQKGEKVIGRLEVLRWHCDGFPLKEYHGIGLLTSSQKHVKYL